MKDSEILLLSKKKITSVATPKQNSTHTQILGFSIITILVLSQKLWVPHSQPYLVGLGCSLVAIIPLRLGAIAQRGATRAIRVLAQTPRGRT